MDIKKIVRDDYLRTDTERKEALKEVIERWRFLLHTIDLTDIKPDDKKINGLVSAEWVFKAEADFNKAVELLTRCQRQYMTACEVYAHVLEDEESV